MITKYGHLGLFYHKVKALFRIGPIPDNIAKAIDSLYPTILDIGKDRRQSLEIRMNVTNYRKHNNSHKIPVKPIFIAQKEQQYQRMTKKILTKNDFQTFKTCDKSP